MILEDFLPKAASSRTPLEATPKSNPEGDWFLLIKGNTYVHPRDWFHILDTLKCRRKDGRWLPDVDMNAIDGLFDIIQKRKHADPIPDELLELAGVGPTELEILKKERFSIQKEKQQRLNENSVLTLVHSHTASSDLDQTVRKAIAENKQQLKKINTRIPKINKKIKKHPK